MQTTETKPKLKLIGTDGNAFAILGAAQRVARKAGWSKEKVSQFMKEAIENGEIQHYTIFLFLRKTSFDNS